VIRCNDHLTGKALPGAGAVHHINVCVLRCTFEPHDVHVRHWHPAVFGAH
jgi:hypothetical protein